MAALVLDECVWFLGNAELVKPRWVWIARGMNPGCAANAATLGCGMQRRWRKNRLSASECTNLSQETQATQQAYGLNDKVTAHFGRNCLLARRLVERGVRFIQLYSGGNDGPSAWDAHDDLKKNHDLHCLETDRPIAP